LVFKGGKNLTNPLKAIGDGIDAGIKLVAGIIVLVLCLYVLKLILSIPH
jgi:hypothetical protein